jgi:hypothetical protein
MVALMLTSMVALMAYGAVHLSIETRARMQRELGSLQSGRILRETLQDALRNARAPQRRGDTTFTLGNGRLSFVAAGTGPPFDPDYDWRITLLTDSGGLEVVGTPVGRAPAARIALREPGITRCDVQVLAPGSTEWITEWPPSTVMPRAIAVTLWHESEQVGPTLEVTLTPRYTSGAGTDDAVE